jgi:hypothetical protein
VLVLLVGAELFVDDRRNILHVKWSLAGQLGGYEHRCSANDMQLGVGTHRSV